MSNSGVILLRSVEMLPDPRVEKYVDYFKQHSIPYILVGWNRSDVSVSKDHTIYFNRPAPFGAGMGNVGNLFRFNRFLIATLKKERHHYHTIHACDFDTILAALYAKIRWRKRVIFDVFDWYSDSRTIACKALRYIIQWLEKWALRRSDYVIICDSERKDQLPISLSENKLFIMPNIPAFDGEVPKFIPNHGALKASYVGIFGEGRGIEDMLAVFSTHPEYRLDIAGFGELTPIVERYASRYDNIFYHGKTDYATSMITMAQSDLIFAMYYKVNRNHIFAAPNKYYEGLFLGKPIITTKGTSIGNKTERYNTGFVIEQTQKDIEQLLTSLSRQQIEECGGNARRLWDEHYADYIECFMNGTYSRMIE